jgi:hypothetical protein
MDQMTTVGASAAVTSPLWIQTLNPYVQFAVAVLGGVWLVTKIFIALHDWWTKKNDRHNEIDGSPRQGRRPSAP